MESTDTRYVVEIYQQKADGTYPETATIKYERE
jgi:hypothetical protein